MRKMWWDGTPLLDLETLSQEERDLRFKIIKQIAHDDRSAGVLRGPRALAQELTRRLERIRA